MEWVAYPFASLSLPNPGIKLWSSVLQAAFLLAELPGMQKIFRAVINGGHVIVHLSRLIECTALRENANVIFGLWMIIM